MKKKYFILLLIGVVLLFCSCNYKSDNTPKEVFSEEQLNDIRFVSIRDFENKDIEEYIISEDNPNNDLLKQYLKEFAGIKVENCKITTEDNVLFYSFDFSNSTEHLEAGHKEYKIIEGFGNCPFWEEAEAPVPDEYKDICGFSDIIVTELDDTFDLDTDSRLDECEDSAVFCSIYTYGNYSTYGSIPKEVLEETARSIFGIESYTPLNSTAIEKNGKYSPTILSGHIKPKSIVKIEDEDDTVTIIYQLYADRMGFFKGDTVKIKFKRADNTIGYEFVETDIVKKSGLKAYNYYS